MKKYQSKIFDKLFKNFLIHFIDTLKFITSQIYCYINGPVCLEMLCTKRTYIALSSLMEYYANKKKKKEKRKYKVELNSIASSQRHRQQRFLDSALGENESLYIYPMLCAYVHFSSYVCIKHIVQHFRNGLLMQLETSFKY